MNKVQFYSFALSPYALKVHCYLLALDIDFETIFVDAMKMREILPVGKTVPVLTVNSESRNESSEIGYWLNELYPEQQLVPLELVEKTQIADKWVNDRLINLAFRDSVGFDDPMIKKYKKRLHLSKALGQTSPNGVSAIFRLAHMLLLEKTFVKNNIAMTDVGRKLDDLRVELAAEFNELLEGGPFLCGSQKPTLADLSAYPQIVKPKAIDGLEYFLPGETVSTWVSNMEKAYPKLLACFPEKIEYAQ